MQIDSRREPARASDWRRFGACRNEDPELFFPDEADPSAWVLTRRAIGVCCRCPVIEACRRDALDSREPFGIRGGLTESQRLAMYAGGNAVAATDPRTDRATDPRTVRRTAGATTLGAGNRAGSAA